MAPVDVPRRRASRQPTVWTGARVARLQALRRQGATPAEIAAELGVTANAVKIKACKLSYEPYRAPARRDRPVPGFSTKVSAQNAKAIAEQARALGLTAPLAVREMIRLAAQHGLVRALLGDAYEAAADEVWDEHEARVPSTRRDTHDQPASPARTADHPPARRGA